MVEVCLSVWASGGPDLLQFALLEMCGFPRGTNHRAVTMTR